MNIDGVRVLSQEAIMESPDFVWTIAAFLVGCMFLFAILAFIVDGEWGFIAFAISGILAFLWIIIAGACGIFNRPSEHYTYKCLFDEDVSIQEIYDGYDIVDRDGDIWVLKDKEK